MPKKTSAWQASDGTLFELEEDAKAWEFRQAFEGWVDSKQPLDGGQMGTRENFIEMVFRDRMKLLPIFKLLNGSPSLAAPPRLPDIEPATEIAKHRTAP